MKINWAYEFKTLSGEQIKDEKGVIQTMGLMATSALMAWPDDERALSGDDKVKRYDLALKILKTPNEDFSIDEVKLVKDQMFKKHYPVIVGQASRILENKEG